RPPAPTLFPYTTLFRSVHLLPAAAGCRLQLRTAGQMARRDREAARPLRLRRCRAAGLAQPRGPSRLPRLSRRARPAALRDLRADARHPAQRRPREPARRTAAPARRGDLLALPRRPRDRTA